MGGNAKEILPLVALAGLGYATGGFGLMGASATGAAGLAPAMTGGAAISGGQAAASGMFSNMFAGIGMREGIGYGLSALSAGAGIMGSMAAAESQKGALKLQESQDALALAEREKNSQEQLQKILAAQTNYYASIGIDASSGSALAAAEGAKREADKDLSLYSYQRNMNQQAYRLGRRGISNARTGGVAASLLDFGGDIYNRNYP